MKNLRRIVLAATLLLAALGSVSAQDAIITILHLNDTHSNLAPIGPRGANLQGTQGGIARAATLIGSIKAAEDNVLTLHAGDSFIGDIFFNRTYGAGELGLLQAIGVDAMTVGNHEFDLGPVPLLGALSYAFQSGAFPLLSANLDLSDPSVAALSNFIFPSITRVVGGVKIGIFGLTTPSANLTSNPSPVIVDDDVLAIAQNTAAALKADGCKLIILLSHLGLRGDRQLAYAVPGIDAVIGGHDHTPTVVPEIIIDALGNPTPVVQADPFYKSLGKLRFSVTNGMVSYMDFALLPINAGIPEYPPVKAVVDGMIADIEAVYGPVYTQQIASAPHPVEELAIPSSRPGTHDTPAGNLVTDAFRDAMCTDIAICAGGSLAQPLYAGPLVSADVFRMLGYGFNTDNGLGFRMATFRMSGAALWAGLELGLAEAEWDDEFFIQVSGMKYWFSLSNPPTKRVTKVVVANKALEPDRMYTVAANEFVPMILSAMGIPFTDLTVYTGLTEFEVTARYIAGLGVVAPGKGGRIVRQGDGAPKESAGTVPAGLSLDGAFPNPFHPHTNVSFSLAEDCHVMLHVYDAAGREVAVLNDGPLSAGRHTMMFDAMGLPSGVYRAVLNANGRMEQKAMVLAK